MSEIKRWAILVMLVSVLLCSAQAEQEKVNFDPFAAEPNLPAASKSTPGSGPVIPQVDFNNNDISMAFQIISDATGWSIFPSEEVSKKKISLWAKNISASELLNRVVLLAGLIYHHEGSIVEVMTYEEYMQNYGLEKKAIQLRYGNSASVEASIKPFLTKLARSVVHKESNTIILYETTANLQFILPIIEKLDNPAQDAAVEVVTLVYSKSVSLAQVLNEVYKPKKDLQQGVAVEANNNTEAKPTTIGEQLLVNQRQIDIFPIEHSNQLVLAGSATIIEDVKKLIQRVDVAGENLSLEVIDIEYADSQIIAETLQKMFSDNEKSEMPLFSTPAVSQEKMVKVSQPEEGGSLFNPQSPVGVYSMGRTNQLIVKAYRNDMEIIRQLVEKLDTYIEPMTKSYHFSYVDVSEIYTGLERIMSIYSGYSSMSGKSGMNSQGSVTGTGRSGLTLVEKSNSILLTSPPGAHRIMESIKSSIDTPSTFETGMIRVYKIENASVDEVTKTIQEILQAQEKETGETTQAKYKQNVPAESGPDTTDSEQVVSKIQTSVADKQTPTTVVVMATARQQREIELLIQELDKRRRQVLIEAKIVEITVTDNLNLGVELNHAKDDVSLFTQFGLSKDLDPATGSRSVIVSEGGTAAVLKPDQIQVILQALKSDSNTRISSAPQILVNDNAAGMISSVAQRPYTTTTQGQNSDQTTFAGFVDAGTEFAITPHISEKNFLRVEYVITLSAFTGSSSDLTIPPPKSTSSIQSEATVPDGYTIVVGGLQRVDDTETVNKIPILGDIPILEWAFKSTKKEKTNKKIFLFITPTILANEGFEDLKQASDNAVKKIEADKTPDKQEEIADANTPQ